MAIHTEGDVRSQIAVQPHCCQDCVELDMDYLGLSEGFQAICLKGHAMTSETCTDQKRGA